MFGSVREWSGITPGCQGVYGSGREASRMYRSGQESLQDVWQFSGVVGPPGFPGVVGSPSRMSRSGRESLPDVRECSGVVGRPSRMSRSGRESLPDVQEW